MSAWLAAMKQRLIDGCDRHLVPDWREAHTFLSNHVLLLIGLIEVIQQYFGDLIPSGYMGGLALIGLFLRLWNQQRGGSNGSDDTER